MQFIRSMTLSRRIWAGRNQAPSALAETDRLIELSSWMLVLGTIRLVCTIADNVNAFLELTHGYTTSARLVGLFVQESHPFIALSVVWPLVLAVLLRKTRWEELLKAVAATFLILSICGVLEFVAECAHTRGAVLMVGSFQLPRRALRAPFASDVILGLLGTTQLLLEFAVAVWSILLWIQFRRSAPTESDRQLTARRALFGRLALFISLAFFVLFIRGSVWSAYLEVLNQSSIVREFVLRNDFERIHSRRTRPRTPAEIEQERQARQMQGLLESARQAWEEGQFAAARDSYLKLVSHIESIPHHPMTGMFRYTASNAFNNLAWLLATCSDPKLRDPAGAITYAKRALGIEPSDGNCWNTLGVAYYRAGELEQAKNALYRSMELRGDGDSFDWFFLALIHFKLGHKERARDWYDRAKGRFQQVEQFGTSLSVSQVDELYRFEVEAAEMMGLPKPVRTSKAMRDVIWWTGAEVIGVPVPLMPANSRKFPQSHSPTLLNGPARLERRASRPLMPALPPRLAQ